MIEIILSRTPMLKCLRHVAAMTLFVLAGCSDKPSNLPVSHWRQDPDACISRTAAAIEASGRPWPNEVVDSSHRVRQFDFWIGEQLYVLPGETPLRADHFAPLHHPLRYWVVTGSASALLGVAPPAGPVGPTLFGQVNCDLSKPTAEWKERREPAFASRDEAVDYYREQMLARPDALSDVEVRRREDLKMIELRARDVRNPGESVGLYFPFDRELKQTIGAKTFYKPIRCRAAHEAQAPMKLYATCVLWISLAPGFWIEFEMYQQMLPYMAPVHDKLLATLVRARTN
ncbi:hypothetical protein LZ009_14210 [Ramlibacter sp. XY19]|uniref:hypothetical protein n=1 Tax=Ramlibacter paludis TaxID=2908000 RepID=UPI0023DC8980|nr:hypothetical protein [Ramlibacter paludis]MCG2593932.1 hypothetical protein [Ramlibacter paludis]